MCSETGERLQYNSEWEIEPSDNTRNATASVPNFGAHSPFGSGEWIAPWHVRWSVPNKKAHSMGNLPPCSALMQPYFHTRSRCNSAHIPATPSARNNSKNNKARILPPGPFGCESWGRVKWMVFSFVACRLIAVTTPKSPLSLIFYKSTGK